MLDTGVATASTGGSGGPVPDKYAFQARDWLYKTVCLNKTGPLRLI